MFLLPSRRTAIALTAAACLTGVAGNAAAQTRSGPVSPFFGEWELDLTRMPGSYGPPPKRVLYGFRDSGDGKWRITVDITDRDDNVRHMALSARPNGTMASSEGEKGEADSAAFMTPTANVLVLNLARQKMPGSVRTYVVAPDGNEMIEAAAAVDANGAPFVRRFHYKRRR